MYCLSLAYWENIIIDVIVIAAIIMLLRLLVAAMGGGAVWPPVVWPPYGGAPAAPSGIVSIIAAALNIVIWAVIMIALVLFIFSLLGCLLGATGGLRWPRY